MDSDTPGTQEAIGEAAQAEARRVLAHATEARVPGWTDPAKRRVVVHYHFFKNAGTSVDEALQAAFPGRWTDVEFDARSRSPAKLSAFIGAHPDPIVFSSHTAVFPTPRIEGLAIFPIAFVRHPIDRIRSVYEFERRQQAPTEGAKAAKELDFRGYVDWRIDLDHLIRNFHVSRFSAGLGRPINLFRARSYVDRLPFVGVVESFASSLAVLSGKLRLAFGGADLVEKHANVTQAPASTLEGRIAETRERLGEPLFQKVLRRNEEDLNLYEYVVRRHRIEAAAP